MAPTIGNMVDTAVIPSVGSLVGTTGQQQLLDAVSSEWGSGVVFGSRDDPFMERHQSFMDRIVQPTIQAGQALYDAGKALVGSQDFQGDNIIPLDSPDKLKDIPPEMVMPILTHPTVRGMLENGQIHGFGVDPETLPDEDYAGRLINNGSITSAEMKELPEDQAPELVWHWKCDDPDWNEEQLDALEVSRKYVDSWLAEWAETNEIPEKDPTYPEKFS